MAKKQKNSKGWLGLKRSLSPLAVAWIFSLVLHAIMSVNLPELPRSLPKNKVTEKPVQIRFTTAQAPRTPQSTKPLSETPLPETKPPEASKSRWGRQNHQTAKETRVEPSLSTKGAEAVAKSSPDPSIKPKQMVQNRATKPKRTTHLPKTTNIKKPSQTNAPRLSITGSSAVKIKTKTTGKPSRKARNPYEALLNGAVAQMQDVAQAGYQESLDEQIELGEAIDINTSHYRYIGYFSSMRKAIEMVWNYPRSAAKRGHQGHVGLKFTIQKDGRVQKVRVTESSGHAMLDNAIVRAVQQAAPFSPLPDGFGRKRLVVMGTFRYVLGY